MPYIDANFRTFADRAQRAMAGLSMGGFETRLITLRNLDLYVSPETAHEWLTWRRSLREFAPLLFRD
jgi:enterochelin esterase-like enzyme